MKEPYKILERLGAGGMGTVYSAEDTRLGRRVAVKILEKRVAGDREVLNRFRREARAASALNHPNICTIHDVGEQDGQPFIVMELVEGRTLRGVDQPVSPHMAARLIGQVAEALSAAHAAGVVHRDIKPENIMVRDDGYVKVMDFGLARLRTEENPQPDDITDAATEPGTLLGTVRYMSPEQARGEATESATDIFSLGQVLYEVATGQHPFAAGSKVGTLNAIVSIAPITPSILHPEIPPELDGLVLAMLNKDPRLRPTAGEAAAVLAEAAGGGARDPTTLKAAATLVGDRQTVGRESELGELLEGLEAARGGHGGLLLVTGEAGIGKTTLVEDFLTEVARSGHAGTVGRGRCSQRLADTEAYLPFVEALESLLHSDSGQSVTRVMRLLAPTWFVHVAPLAAHDSSVFRSLEEARAESGERVKRELIGFFQELAQIRPLILFIDDLHWADLSTVDLLAFLGPRLESMRMLIVVTYRPEEMTRTKNPFLEVKLDLQGHGVCREMPLQFLSRGDVDKYLALEFPEHGFPEGFPDLIHSKTEGNPLFVVDLVRSLRDRDVIAEENGRWRLAQQVPQIEQELPESVRSLIEGKIGRLSDEDRKLLVAASVQGDRFEAAVVAQALDGDPAEVEERLQALESSFYFVEPVQEVEFPDKTLTQRYRFVHHLYQNELYGSLTPARRAALSKGVAGALLGFYGEKSSSIASELAILLESARDFLPAAEHFMTASSTAAHVFAHQEAAALARRGLQQLENLPLSFERGRLELPLLMTLGAELMLFRGYADPEAEQAYARARQLCQLAGDMPELVPVLWGLHAFDLVRAQHESAKETARQLMKLAEPTADPAMLIYAHWAMSGEPFLCGDFAAAHEHFERALDYYDPEQHRELVRLYRDDAGVGCQAYSAWLLWLIGYPEQARERADAAVNHAEQLKRPYGQAYALAFAAAFHQLRGEPDAALARAEKAVEISADNGFALWLAWATIYRGWALAMKGQGGEGIEQIRGGLEAYRACGAKIARSRLVGLLAEAHAAAGQTREGLAALEEAIEEARGSGEIYFEPEFLRLRGQMILSGEDAGGDAEAEASRCFNGAIELSRRQGAKSWELRATVDACRLLQRHGKSEEALDTLDGIFDWFTEGLETPDLRAAATLLEELSA